MSATRARSSYAAPAREAYGDFDHQEDILDYSDASESEDDCPVLLCRNDSSDDDNSSIDDQNEAYYDSDGSSVPSLISPMEDLDEYSDDEYTGIPVEWFQPQINNLFLNLLTKKKEIIYGSSELVISIFLSTYVFLYVCYSTIFLYVKYVLANLAQQ